MLVGILVVSCSCEKDKENDEQQLIVEEPKFNNNETELQQIKREEEVLTENLKIYFKAQAWKDDIEVGIIERRGNKEAIDHHISYLENVLGELNKIQDSTIDESALRRFNEFMNHIEGIAIPLDSRELVKDQQNIVKAKQIVNLTLQLYKNLKKQAELENN
ncbi:hypothetical protein [Candidatus Amoebophilus asiaticus]|nr:hypothetical protein [Candidatus Amoebophilus asiaticus]